MKNHKLSTILKLVNDLIKQELMMLNQAIVSLIKTQQDVDFKKAAITLTKGDIVSFKNSSGITVQGVITRKNPKTLQVTTPDNYYVNIPATYLTPVKSSSKKMQNFRRFIYSTFKEMKKIFNEEVEKGTFH